MSDRAFGQANPTFIGAITGITNGDDITASYSSVASTNSPAGTYAIVPSLVDPNNRQTNYTVSIVEGALTIGQATASILWTNPTPIVYGTSLSSILLNATATALGTFWLTLPVMALFFHRARIPSPFNYLTDTIDYHGATTTVSMIVSLAPLTVTAVNAKSSVWPRQSSIYRNYHWCNEWR